MNTFGALFEAVGMLRRAWRLSGIEAPPAITLHFKDDRDKHRFSTHVKHAANTQKIVTVFTSDPTRLPDVMEIMGVKVMLYSPHDLDRGKAFEPPRG